jgi:hypothetical protein
MEADQLRTEVETSRRRLTDVLAFPGLRGWGEPEQKSEPKSVH